MTDASSLASRIVPAFSAAEGGSNARFACLAAAARLEWKGKKC